MLNNHVGRSLMAVTVTLVGACADTRDAIGATAGDADTTAAAQVTPSEGGDGFPCAVQTIVESKCQTCHGARPLGSPLSFTSPQGFQGAGLTDPSRPLTALAHERVNATDPRRRMPPASASQLTPDEVKTLSDWLLAGAKPGAACGAPAPVDPAPDQPSKGGSGGASNEPIEYDDPELECYRFTAYASAADKSQKYPVPTTPDIYVGFNIKAPWSGTRYIRSFKSIIDNGEAIHHWLLYRQLQPGGTERVIPGVSGAHPDGELLYGWAPGTNDLWFDPDVGIELPGDTMFQLEAHYNNTTGAPAPDASGVEVCVTPKKPTHVAGFSFLGTDIINGTSASGTCSHESKEPVHVILAFPHMHTKGTHMKVDWQRADGTTRTIHDEPFSFEFQRTYVLNDVVLAPGDKLKTTCTYGSPARFGTGTKDEMCYFFSMHWPHGSLSKKNFWTAFHGPNTCID